MPVPLAIRVEAQPPAVAGLAATKEGQVVTRAEAGEVGRPLVVGRAPQAHGMLLIN